jgi:hypothetical protein
MACYKHGMYGTPTYKTWNMMKQRCLNPKNDNYHKYGALGVTVCEKWLTFEGFYADMGVRPEGCTLNRIGSAKIYSKDTCEWATLGVQSFDQVIDKRNKLGIKEVRFRKDRLKWEARITVDKVKHLLYYGNDFFEACCRRKAAEIKHY